MARLSPKAYQFTYVIYQNPKNLTSLNWVKLTEPEGPNIINA